MHVFAFLVALLFAALQVQGVAIPGKSVRDDANTTSTPDVTVKLVAVDGTMIDAKPDGKPTQSNFVHTSTTQSICIRSDKSR